MVFKATSCPISPSTVCIRQLYVFYSCGSMAVGGHYDGDHSCRQLSIASSWHLWDHRSDHAYSQCIRSHPWVAPSPPNRFFISGKKRILSRLCQVLLISILSILIPKFGTILNFNIFYSYSSNEMVSFIVYLVPSLRPSLVRLFLLFYTLCLSREIRSIFRPVLVYGPFFILLFLLLLWLFVLFCLLLIWSIVFLNHSTKDISLLH